MKKILILLLTLFLPSCSYLKYASIQAEYSRLQNAEPGQVHLKHMIDSENFFIIGKTLDPQKKYSKTYLTIAAFSNRFKQNERVDTMYFASAGTHYGLNLPQGAYTLLVFADLDHNNVLDKAEIIGQTKIELNDATAPEKGLTHIDIPLSPPVLVDWVDTIPLPRIEEPRKSLFFPVGAIRSLDDPIFDHNMTTIGMYDPASFNERVPTMFFALEEDLGYKIPVVFVHGIGGSSRAFQPIIDRLDRARYKPWFYYYPSGGDLEQLGNLFYKIYLSGDVVHLGPMPMIIVAHSMGGLVIREALNISAERSGKNKVKLFVTIATPFGGHPAAAIGEEHGLLVLPAWRDVNPDSRFMKKLYRKPFGKSLNHLLIYAYQNPDIVKISENSDGVVPLSSQLYSTAQKQSSAQFGFNSHHTSILEDEEMITYVLDHMKKVKNFFPDDHLQYLQQGGYAVDLGEGYSPLVQYFIHHYGKYATAITNKVLNTIYDEQEEFLRAARHEIPPTTDLEKGWLKFIEEYPEVAQ